MTNVWQGAWMQVTTLGDALVRMMRGRSAAVAVGQVAMPPLRGCAVHPVIGELPSLKATVPVAELGATCAVNVTDWPYTEGL